MNQFINYKYYKYANILFYKFIEEKKKNVKQSKKDI